MYSFPATRGHARFASIATAVVIGLSVALIARTIWLLDRGLDVTDNAVYLMVAQRPAAYDVGFGLWGYGLHPLLLLAGGSVAIMERTGGLILVLLGAGLGALTSAKLRIDWRSPAGAQLVAVVASLPLAYYSQWLPMPSYNWIALVSGLGLLIAIVLLCGAGGDLLSSAAIAAVAILLAVFARPQNAAGYGVLYLAAIYAAFATNQERLKQVFRAACFGVIALAAVAAVLPIGIVVDQLKTYFAIFGTHHPTQFSTLQQQTTFLISAWAWLVSGVVFAVAVFARRGDGVPSGKIAKAIIIFTAVVSAAVVLQGLYKHEFRFGSTAGILAFCALSLACLRTNLNARLLVLLGVAAVIPWAATLGSSNEIRFQLSYFSGLSIFIALASFTAAARANMILVSAASCIALFITASQIESGLANPFRLATPVALQVVPTPIGFGSELKLDSMTSAFVVRLQTVTRQGGFCPGDTAIDLSGNLQGAVLVIGGIMPVFPSMLAGYSYSQGWAREYLRRVGSQRLAQSWLIVNEADGALTEQQLSQVGIDFSGYRLMDELRHPVDGTQVKLYAPLAARAPC